MNAVISSKHVDRHEPVARVMNRQEPVLLNRTEQDVLLLSQPGNIHYRIVREKHQESPLIQEARSVPNYRLALHLELGLT